MHNANFEKLGDHGDILGVNQAFPMLAFDPVNLFRQITGEFFNGTVPGHPVCFHLIVKDDLAGLSDGQFQLCLGLTLGPAQYLLFRGIDNQDTIKNPAVQTNRAAVDLHVPDFPAGQPVAKLDLAVTLSGKPATPSMGLCFRKGIDPGHGHAD